MPLFPPEEVFTPGVMPTYTYIERSELEGKLRSALDTPGMLVSVSGPTKTGKTVLAQRVVGDERLIKVAGSSIQHVHDVWRRAGEADLTVTNLAEPAVETISRLIANEQVLVLDDFHYVPRDVQGPIAQQLKDAIARGLRCIIVSVPHRSDDPIRANPDLRGRVRTIDLDYWETEQVAAIADRGFPLLNVELSPGTRTRLAAQSLRTPQLMQLMCLETCRYFGITGVSADRRPLQIEEVEFRTIGSRVAEYTNARTAFEILNEGPATRGRQRTTYHLSNGAASEVYGIVLRAIAADPPVLSLNLNEIKRRVAQIVPSAPAGGLAGRVAASVKQMDILMSQRSLGDRVLEWDEERQTLDILDPYFLLYLKWSGALL